MSKRQPLNKAIDAINHYRGRVAPVNTSYTPPSFVGIRDMFQQAKNNGVEVIVESSEINNMDSVRLTLDYIGDRWCSGYELKEYWGELIKIPRTIHYSEVYVSSHEVDRSKVKTKIYFRGDNPFG